MAAVARLFAMVCARRGRRVLLLMRRPAAAAAGMMRSRWWEHTASSWWFDMAMLIGLSAFYLALVRWKIRLKSA